ncbi:hypothetical protein EVAR_61741_1 [Eumeta japonica]|uniref:Uncharacterized protein n=1 Tax=Eumeta variegata TaxID=151549 RepID=A0A4C1YM03_EUMVA|nr:hypothetical protein EVAR_61741_1 [Eumeta japonica]
MLRAHGLQTRLRKFFFTALEAVGGFARRASLKTEIGRPLLSVSGRSAPRDLSKETPRIKTHNHSFAPDTRPIGIAVSKIKRCAQKTESELVNKIYQHRSQGVGYKQIGHDRRARSSPRGILLEIYLEREKANRAKDYEAVEKRKE